MVKIRNAAVSVLPLLLIAGCAGHTLIAQNHPSVDRKPASSCSYYAMPVQIMKKKADCPGVSRDEYTAVSWGGIAYDPDGGPVFGTENQAWFNKIGMTYAVTIPHSNSNTNKPYPFEYPIDRKPLKIDAMRVIDHSNMLIENITLQPDSLPTGFGVSAWSDCHSPFKHYSSVMDNYLVYVDKLGFEPCSGTKFPGETSCAASYVYNDLIWIKFEVTRVCQ